MVWNGLHGRMAFCTLNMAEHAWRNVHHVDWNIPQILDWASMHKKLIVKWYYIFNQWPRTVASTERVIWNCMIAALQWWGDIERRSVHQYNHSRTPVPWMTNDDIFLGHWSLTAIVSLVNIEEWQHCTSHLVLLQISLSHAFLCGRFNKGIAARKMDTMLYTCSSRSLLWAGDIYERFPRPNIYPDKE